MRFPLVLRSQHEEVVRALEEVVRIRESVSARQDRQIAELEEFNKTMLNQVWLGQFGVPLFPGPPDAPPPTAPEPTPAERLEEEASEEVSRERAKLTMLRHTSPSKLGAALSGVMAKDMIRRANAAAHPPPAVHSSNPAKAIFETAKSEVEP